MRTMRLVSLALLFLSIHVSGQPVIWSDDFSNPATWQMTIAPGAPNTPWVIGTQPAAGDAAIEMIQSTTAGNNFALLDSDFHGSESSFEVESSMLTTAAPIDLTGQPYVLLQFETYYKKFNYEACFVVISTNNLDWPDLDPTYNAENDPNVFRIFPGMQDLGFVDNPTLRTLNISAVAGGQPQVWVRFHWTGVWGFAWYVDDVAMIVQPEHDMVMIDAGIANNAEGIMHGRIPASQTTTMHASTSNFNRGHGMPSNPQLIVRVNDQGGSLVYEGVESAAMLPSWDTTAVIHQFSMAQFNSGLYTVTMELTSDQEPPGSPSAVDNAMVRIIEISADRYSLDNIGNHPGGEVLTSLGSNSFENNADGMMVMTHYVTNSPLTVHGFEVLLDTEPLAGTGVGGQIFFVIYDSADVHFNLPFSYVPNLADPVAEAPALYTITAQDVANGKVEWMFPSPVQLPAGGSYYAAVELFSGGAEGHILIVDDATLEQPAWASLIYLPNAPNFGGSANRIWSNGNAYAIRLITEPEVSAPDPCEAHFLVMQGMTLPDSIPVPGLVWIVDNTTGGSGTYSYNWDMGDGTVYTDPNPSHDFLTNGPFMVCLTIDDLEGCTDTYCQEISVDDSGMINGMFPGGGAIGFSVQVLPAPIITEIATHSTASRIPLWPNPADDLLMFTTGSSGSLSIDVLDIQGRPVLQQSMFIPPDGIGTLPVHTLAPGTYILRTNSQAGSKEQRFIKL